MDIWSLSCMLLGIVFNRTPFFRGKDNYEQLRKIEEVLGSEELDKYIAKYHLKLNKETKCLLGHFERRPWTDFVSKTTEKFINDDLFDFLDKTLVYDHNDRLTAKEAMAHKWFDPVRDDVEKELVEWRKKTEAEAEPSKKVKMDECCVCWESYGNDRGRYKVVTTIVRWSHCMRHIIPLIQYYLDPMNDNNRDEAEVLVEEHAMAHVYRHPFDRDVRITMNADEAKEVMKIIRDECDEHLIRSETHSLRRYQSFVYNTWTKDGLTCHGSYIVKGRDGETMKGVALVIGDKLYISNLLDTDKEDCIIGFVSLADGIGPGEEGDESLDTNKSRCEIPLILKAAIITIRMFKSQKKKLCKDDYWTVYHCLWGRFNENEKDALCRVHHNEDTTLKVNFKSVKGVLNSYL